VAAASNPQIRQRNPGDPVHVAFTKYSGARHWHFDTVALGADRHGVWLGAKAGTPLQRGEEQPIPWACDFAVLVPWQGHWMACFNDSGRFLLYIDVTGPISWPDPHTVTTHDLDLDVARTADGETVLLDEDEFAEHQARYGYPSELVTTAETTAKWLLRAVQTGAEPFADTGPRWLQVVRNTQRLVT
jgi:uncharacterized protein